jgi:CRISPR-associated endonuclease Cas1
MPPKPKAPRGEICVATGYGVKIYVERGHLVVHDGIGRDRETRRYHRATSELSRVVVVGHTGFVTLEALRWIRDVGAVLVQIDSDSNLIASTVSEWFSSSRELRRAQVLAAESENGLQIEIELISDKLERQAEVAATLAEHRPSLTVSKRVKLSVADAIRAQIKPLRTAASMAELRKIESIAGRYYWQTFAHLPIAFESNWRVAVPEHWHLAGPRTSPIDRKRAKRALTPAHAVLNYLYAILECETTIAAYRMGFDPSLGLMHTDKRYRPSLASDLMEPVRPLADRVAIELLSRRELSRADVFETREGVCRLGPGLARELGAASHRLRDGVAPKAEWLASRLLDDSQHPTPLTRRRHRASRSSRA